MSKFVSKSFFGNFSTKIGEFKKVYNLFSLTFLKTNMPLKLPVLFFIISSSFLCL